MSDYENRLEHIDFDHLSGDAIDTTPIDRDWSEGWTERWEFRTVVECNGCERPLVYNGSYAECENEDCEMFEEQQDEFYDEGPMMNYAYPLPDSPTDATVLELDHLPLVVVDWYEDNSSELALSGGGMDLSWEICEAFIVLGYLPPLHFCDLPRMCKQDTPANRRIIEACKLSAKVAGMRSGRVLERLTEAPPIG